MNHHLSLMARHLNTACAEANNVIDSAFADKLDTELSRKYARNSLDAIDAAVAIARKMLNQYAAENGNLTEGLRAAVDQESRTKLDVTA